MNNIEQETNALSQIATRQQQKAANPKLSVWVQASAGTGKTKVLSDRVLRLLLQNVNPSRILCLTYTKAAAVEMNARIANRLSHWAVAPQKDLIKDLQSLVSENMSEKECQQLVKRARILFALLLDVPGGLKIQTIHSFCQEILKRFPIESGVSPYFNVLDDRAAKEALNTAATELLSRMETAPHTPEAQAMAFLTTQIKEFSFNKLISLLIEKRSAFADILSAYDCIQDFEKALMTRLGLKQIKSLAEAEKDFYQTLDIEKLRQIADVLGQSASVNDKKAARIILEQTNLDIAKLENTKLENTNLENTNLGNANLDIANLGNTKLENANLENTNLENAKLENTNLENTNLENANLENAKLENANLDSAKLENAKLENAKLENAKLENAKLENANLENANQFDFETFKGVFLTGDDEIRDAIATKSFVKKFPFVGEFLDKLAQDVLAFVMYLKRLNLFLSTRAVMIIAGTLGNAYMTFKRQNAELDYEDLIHLTKRLLENEGATSWVLYKLDGGISHILIDEAQDTSPQQWAIIKALSAEFFDGAGQSDETRTVFAVGDRKQSIYSFQGADPAAFDEMSKYFAQKSTSFEKVRLDVSFRSTAAVLETVNHLFDMPTAQSGVVLEDEKVSHLPFRLGQGGRVEIWPLIEPEDDEEDVWYPPVERAHKPLARTRLAEKIAQNIQQMVARQEVLESKGRALQYSDFMVLVQRRNAFMDDFIRACKQIGVNIAGADKIKLLEHIAVQDLISLAKFLLLPEDDLSLAEVLKSPLFGLDDDDLMQLCIDRGTTALWQRLKANSKYAPATETLSALLAKADYIRPFELFSYVLSVYGGRQKFVARLGKETEDALDEFMNLTLDFEREHTPSLQAFLQWLEEDDVEIKRETEQPQANAVRIMTVHGSKGLQAPVVILPDTVRVPNIKREAALLVEDNQRAYFPLNADGYEDICNALYETEKQKEYDEYRRLLYVALTRAEDRLYVCGYKSKNKINEQCWYNLCAETLKTWGKEKGGNLVYESEQVVAPKTALNQLEETPQIKLPSWALEDAPQAEPLARPYTPSKPDDDEIAAASPLNDEGFYYKRGLLIHKLLQLLPSEIDKVARENLMRIFFKKNAPELSEKTQNQLVSEISALFDNPSFAFIFGACSQAEVPIIGRVENKIVSAQIDRLIVLNDRVVVVDFKTNRPAAQDLAQVPAVYKNQLSTYQKLVAQIYPDRPVEGYILWTNTGDLMKVI